MRALRGLLTEYFSVTGECSVSTQGLLRACSVISHVHPEFTRLSLFYASSLTIDLYLSVEPILDNTSQNPIDFESCLGGKLSGDWARFREISVMGR